MGTDGFHVFTRRLRVVTKPSSRRAMGHLDAGQRRGHDPHPSGALMPTMPWADRPGGQRPSLWERPARWVRPARAAARQATARGRALPDSLIIGAQKSGTTSLYAYLSGASRRTSGQAQGSALLRPRTHCLGGKLGENWYRSMFPLRARLAVERRRAGRPVLTGEATPYYLFHPVAPERAAALVPDARLLAVVRDPVERAWSHYRHEVAAGREPLDFAKALDAEDERLAGAEGDLRRGVDSAAAHNHRTCSYRGRGCYAEQLRAWLAHYPREQLHVMVAEELFASPEPVWRDAVEFLGLASAAPPPFDVHGQASRDRNQEMDEVTRARLREEFAGPNADLADLLGRALPW